VLEFKGIGGHGGSTWLCECDCYKKTQNIKTTSQLKKSKSCGCRHLPNLVNHNFGRWKVIKHAKKDIWLCRCSCNNGTIRGVDGRRLRAGLSNSCGCVAKEKHKKYNKYDLSGDFGVGYTTSGDEFCFDLDDYDKIKNICWSMSKRNAVIGGFEGKSIKLHRLIMNCLSRDVIIDHIDRDFSNNKKNNLREVTNQENSFNSKLRYDNKSGIVGVLWWKRDGNWVAQIKHNYKRMFLGYYDKKEDAIKARLRAELKYFGIDFAPQRHLFEKYGITKDE